MKKTGKWKIILIAIFMLPMVVFFPGCSCGKNNNNAQLDAAITNQTFTVMFVTGTSSSFNLNYYNIKYDSLIKAPQEPERTGYEFVCWCKDIGLTTPWTFSIDTVRSNITLYAKWEKINYQ